MAAKLESIGLSRVGDLWFHLPLRYEDLTRISAIADLAPGMQAQVEGVVEAAERGFRFRPQLRVVLDDGSRSSLVLRFFHFNLAQADRFAPGSRWRVHGEVRAGALGLEMVHPTCRAVAPGDPLESGLTPIYPSTEGVHPRRIATLVQQALALLPEDDALECVPPGWRRRLGLGSLRDALCLVHRPPPESDVRALLERRHPAQARLAFDELLAHRLSLRSLRRDAHARPAPVVDSGNSRRGDLIARLGFALTEAQRRVLSEIDADLCGGRPMLRLVQGDVGSGKTVVAALAALAVVDSGWQAAVLAPTEVLAMQHFASFQNWCEALGVRLVWLAGSLTARQRRLALGQITGEADIIIGTHALIQQEVRFRRLGLAVIDEQHRFGVRQRLLLRDKGAGLMVPHQLIMTATPIPRTLAMTAYADLDVSVIDELPPGRSPVSTVVMNAGRRTEVIDRIRGYCAEGRQVYWVCTLIEESEMLEAQAAEAAQQMLVESLPGIGVGFVHGRMRAADKAQAMSEFKAGRLGVLVATTVIEVGVDVPNASLMVIENAERLGLSQLHQLRGRVGRGSAASTCVLLYQPPLSQAARKRLDVMRESNDGFRIAEKDLELRGPGEVLGTRQTGLAGFRVADLARDSSLLPAVAETAETLLSLDPKLASRLVARWIGSSVRYAEA